MSRFADWENLVLTPMDESKGHHSPRRGVVRAPAVRAPVRNVNVVGGGRRYGGAAVGATTLGLVAGVAAGSAATSKQPQTVIVDNGS